MYYTHNTTTIFKSSTIHGRSSTSAFGPNTFSCLPKIPCKFHVLATHHNPTTTRNTLATCKLTSIVYTYTYACIETLWVHTTYTLLVYMVYILYMYVCMYARHIEAMGICKLVNLKGRLPFKGKKKQLPHIRSILAHVLCTLTLRICTLRTFIHHDCS